NQGKRGLRQGLGGGHLLRKRKPAARRIIAAARLWLVQETAFHQRLDQVERARPGPSEMGGEFRRARRFLLAGEIFQQIENVGGLFHQHGGALRLWLWSMYVNIMP